MSGDLLLIIGNVNVDVAIGPVGALPPRGTEITVERGEIRVAGAAGNAARAAAALGRGATVVATVGNDDLGELCVSALAREGIDTSKIRQVAGATGISVALLDVTGERTFITATGASGAVDNRDLPAASLSGTAEAILLTGYWLLPHLTPSDVVEVGEAAREADVPFLLDAGWPAEGWTDAVRSEYLDLLSHVDHLLPNADEALALSGCDDVEAAAAWLAARLRRGVIITTGSSGCIVAEHQGNVCRVPRHASRGPIRDTVGAGDTFAAALAHSLIAAPRADLVDHARYANEVAGRFVRTGTAAPG